MNGGRLRAGLVSGPVYAGARVVQSIRSGRQPRAATRRRHSAVRPCGSRRIRKIWPKGRYCPTPGSRLGPRPSWCRRRRPSAALWSNRRSRRSSDRRGARGRQRGVPASGRSELRAPGEPLGRMIARFERDDQRVFDRLCDEARDPGFAGQFFERRTIGHRPGVRLVAERQVPDDGVGELLRSLPDFPEVARGGQVIDRRRAASERIALQNKGPVDEHRGELYLVDVG